MHRRNYTLHVALALGLITLAAAVGRIERWEWKRGDVTRRVVELAPAAPAAPRGAEVSEAAEERDSVGDALRIVIGERRRLHAGDRIKAPTAPCQDESSALHSP